MAALTSDLVAPAGPRAARLSFGAGTVALGATGLAAIGGALAADHGAAPADAVRLVLVLSFVGAGVALDRNESTVRLGWIVFAGSVAGALRTLAEALVARGDVVATAEAVSPLAAAAVVAVGVHLVLALPDGRLETSPRRVGAGLAYGSALVAGIAGWATQPDPVVWPTIAFAAIGAALVAPASHRRYLETRGVVRQRMHWLGIAVALVAETAAVVLTLRLLVDWPGHPGAVIAGSVVLVPAALVAGASRRFVGEVGRLLTHAVSFAGLTLLVVTVYLVIVVGLGRVPTDDERSILLLSMAAAGVSGLLYLPARTRLTEAANRLVYGEARDPGDAVETFGTRMTRALPLDELLLQLAELLQKHLDLASCDVWAGADGRLERAASVPDRGPATITLGEQELPVVTRAGVSGKAWAAVWLPAVVQGRADTAPMRVAPMAHSGELFGLIVVERRPGDDELADDDERVIAELARQVGLALKNSELDTALAATLEEVQRKNVELQESRTRLVAAGDAERRKIERNLHDGAQQHLVALAVKLRLVQRVAESDVAQALAMLDEARTDVQATVEELRALAHGIYPPLLMDKGLPDALAAAATRAVLTTSVDVDGIGRFPQDVEAAVYFCCLEAIQNAGKHAGEAAAATISLTHADGELCFDVVDDGAGFDLEERRAAGSLGHGFVNMADRLGAMGGTIAVWSAPGQGTRITGRVRAEPVAADGI